MKARNQLLVGGIATCIAGLAWATATVGAFDNFVLSTGTVNADVHAHAHVEVAGSDDGFNTELETEGASNFIVQDVKFSPGGTTGWHKHPGILLLTLTADSGSVDWYDSKCKKHVYNAGDAWTEGTSIHDVVNNSSIDAHFIVTYVVAKGQPKRTDVPASGVPACAAALGLN